MIAGIILIGGGVILAIRFTFGLASVTNLTHTYPWGLWIGFGRHERCRPRCRWLRDLDGGLPVRDEEYKPVVRPALLTGFLGYTLVVLGLIADLGRPWHLPYPFIRSAGPTSALFEVSLCVALCLTVLMIESTPPVLEWLGLKWVAAARGQPDNRPDGLRAVAVDVAPVHPRCVFMVTPTKLHPLWYTSHIPVHFFHLGGGGRHRHGPRRGVFLARAFAHQIDTSHEQQDRITLGLAKGGAVTLMIYFSVKVMNLALRTSGICCSPAGALVSGGAARVVLVPCLMFMVAYREGQPVLARVAGLITVIGVVLNRLTSR